MLRCVACLLSHVYCPIPSESQAKTSTQFAIAFAEDVLKEELANVKKYHNVIVSFSHNVHNVLAPPVVCLLQRQWHSALNASLTFHWNGTMIKSTERDQKSHVHSGV